MFRKKKTPTLPTNPVDYPAGICVVTDQGRYLINRDGKRYRIVSDRIFDSWNFPLIVKTTEPALKNFPVAVTKLAFRDGTLLNNIADGKMYLVSGGKVRHVVSPDALTRLGISPADAIFISGTELNLMKVGEEIY